MTPRAEGAVLGTTSPDPEYRIRLSRQESLELGLLLGGPPVRDLLRRPEHAQFAVGLMLARLNDALDLGIVPYSHTASFIAGFIRSVQHRALADFAFDIVAEINQARMRALIPMGKRQRAINRPRHSLERRVPPSTEGRT